MSDVLVFDIETTGLELDSKIHCLCINDLRSGELTVFNDQGNAPSITTGVTLLDDSDVWLVGHNIVGYDLMVLKNHYPFLHYSDRVLDTVILSRLKYPNMDVLDAKANKIPTYLRGRHSLESWGYRLRCHKGDYNNEHTDWSKWTPELEEYCKQDVILNTKLWNHFHKVYPGLP